MKHPKYILITMLILVATVVGVGQKRTTSRSPNEMGKIRGLVLDANDARIVGATIVIENPRFKRELKSGEDGDFEVRLPAGVYQIKAEMRGFRQFELSPFTVNANVTELINIHMEVGMASSQPLY